MAINAQNFKTICYLKPSANNPRNSEGDFLKLKDGRIMFAYSRYFSGNNWDDCAPCSIAAVFSDDNGETFNVDNPVILVTAEEFGEENLMSVSLMEMANGDAGVFFILKRPAPIEYYLKRSNDNCKSFYQTIRCVPDIHDGYYVVNNCRVDRLSSGRLIIPSSLHRVTRKSDGNKHFDGRADAYFFYSDDDGFTWHESPGIVYLPTGSYTTTGLQETGVVELPNNTLYAYFRTDMHVQYESFSVDGGMRWTAAQPSRFTSPASPMKIKRNPYSGKYYSIWNPIPNYNGRANIGYSWGRTPIVIAESADGLNFGGYVALDDDQDRGYCYPAIYFLDADTALVAYCSGGKEDKGCLCRITIKKIIL